MGAGRFAQEREFRFSPSDAEFADRVRVTASPRPHPARRSGKIGLFARGRWESVIGTERALPFGVEHQSGRGSFGPPPIPPGTSPDLSTKAGDFGRRLFL